MRSPLLVLTVGALMLLACSSSDDDGTVAVGASGSATDEVAGTGSTESVSTPPSVPAEPDVSAGTDGSSASAPSDGSAPASGADATSEPTSDRTGGGADDPTAELEESLSELGVGGGTGTVEIGRATWTFDAEICDARDGFVATGLAAGPGGAAGFVEIYVDVGADLDGDGEPDESASVSLTIGKTELLGEDDPEQPLWLAMIQSFGRVDRHDFTYEIDGSTISGEGRIRDVRGVAAPPKRRFSLSFEAECG